MSSLRFCAQACDVSSCNVSLALVAVRMVTVSRSDAILVVQWRPLFLDNDDTKSSCWRYENQTGVQSDSSNEIRDVLR
jgi:hypothetical protein